MCAFYCLSINSVSCLIGSNLILQSRVVADRDITTPIRYLKGNTSTPFSKALSNNRKKPFEEVTLLARPIRNILCVHFPFHSPRPSFFPFMENGWSHLIIIYIRHYLITRRSSSHAIGRPLRREVSRKGKEQRQPPPSLNFTIAKQTLLFFHDSKPLEQTEVKRLGLRPNSKESGKIISAIFQSSKSYDYRALIRLRLIPHARIWDIISKKARGSETKPTLYNAQ